MLSTGYAVDAAAANPRNIIVNGGFSLKDADGHAVGWQASHNTGSVETEQGNAFFRLTSDYASQVLPIPKSAREAKVSCRFRSSNSANFDITMYPGNGGFCGGGIDRAENKWKPFTATAKIPPGNTSFRISLNASKGTVDFDDVVLEVEVKRCLRKSETVHRFGTGSRTLGTRTKLLLNRAGGSHGSPHVTGAPKR